MKMKIVGSTLNWKSKREAKTYLAECDPGSLGQKILKFSISGSEREI